MSTFTCPISLVDFQYYLGDTSSDSTYKANLQLLLDAATSRVYTYLRRDYSPNAVKNEFFRGNDTQFHQLRFPDVNLSPHPLIAINYTDLQGAIVVLDKTKFQMVDGNQLFGWAPNFFYRRYYYAVQYKIDASLVCPEQVKLAVAELAYHAFNQSRRGLGTLGHATDISNVLGQSQLRLEDPWKEISLRLMPFIWFGGG